MLDRSVGSNKGQMLIEAMVAMSVISIGMLGVFSLLANSLGIGKVTSNQYVGTYLAAEGIEVVKNMIDTNVNSGGMAWNSGLAQNGYTFAVQYDSASTTDETDVTKPLLFDSSTGLYSYTVGKPTVFTRAITVTNLMSGNEIQVDSVVSWTDQGDTKDSVQLEDHFYNWR